MSNITVFQFNTSSVRTLVIDGQPWFVAKDLCDILSLNNVSQALSRLLPHEKNTITINEGNRGNPTVAIVSESGMYAIVLTSRKDEAVAFREWVTSEILPSLRKTGTYSIDPYGPQSGLFWWKRFKQFRADNKVPAGYFAIFEETLRLVADLEDAGYIIPDDRVPDISVGLCWANHLRSEGIEPTSIAVYYPHKYPDKRGTVQAYAYDEDYLPKFRKWFRNTYKPVKLTAYMKKHDINSLPAIQKMLSAA